VVALSGIGVGVVMVMVAVDSVVMVVGVEVKEHVNMSDPG